MQFRKMYIFLKSKPLKVISIYSHFGHFLLAALPPAAAVGNGPVNV